MERNAVKILIILLRSAGDTLSAFVVQFTCVNVGVFLHVTLLVEPLAAVLAGIRPRVRMNEQMSGQGRRSLEGLPALLALKLLIDAVT